MLQQAHHVPLDCVTNFRRGTVVPQRLWCPKTTTDLRQYVVDAPLQMPIFFVNQDGSVGLSVNDAIEGNSLNSVWANIPANLGGKASTHIRIAVRYKDWKRQFQTKDETSNRKPITQGKLVKHVGRSVDVFLKLQGFGESGITHDDIIIVGIVHVSSGSWQPILQLNRHICLSMCGV
ncbi:hypothetical protein OF83DRAFT_1052226 [Amylostereum chailletii]|nr:hypothetical protein OF83DRAFT_1052226 [Amylostereum chailletii]